MSLPSQVNENVHRQPLEFVETWVKGRSSQTWSLVMRYTEDDELKGNIKWREKSEVVSELSARGLVFSG